MPVYYNEYDPFAAAWLRELIKDGHIAPGEVDERSIEDVRPTDLMGFTQHHFFAGIGVWSLALRRAGWPDDRPVWTGSCPCQPFSTGGKRGGFADERHLWPAFFHLIQQCRPVAVFGEQVASPDGLAWLELVQADMEAQGYAFGAVDTCAAGFGAPHIRQRLYWVADAKNNGREIRNDDSGASPRREESWAWTERRSNLSGLELADLQHQQSARNGKGPSNVGGTGAADGLGHSASGAQHGHGAADGSPLRETNRGAQPESSGNVERPGPVNGLWADADWLRCRDEKWRAVKPSHVIMANDWPGQQLMDGSRGTGDSQTETKDQINEELQTMRIDAATQNIQERTSRAPDNDGSPSILRSKMHGSVANRADQGCKSEELPETISAIGERSLQPLRDNGKEAARSSPRPQPNQKRAGELGDIVRLLPCSIALAELRSDYRTAQSLQALSKAICKAGFVQYPSDSLQEIWERLGEEDKNRLRMDFNHNAFMIMRPFPLADAGAFRNRVGLLRGAGNAITLGQAQGFIEAYLNHTETGCGNWPKSFQRTPLLYTKRNGDNLKTPYP